jgi:hypothetical protein
MKQINQLTQVLIKIIAAVAGLKGKGSYQEAMEMTSQAFNEYLDLDIDALLEMDTAEMIHTLEELEAMNHENLESVADLFYTFAMTDIREGSDIDDQSKSLLNRSLSIYKHIEAQGNIYSIDRNHRIEEIEKLKL